MTPFLASGARNSGFWQEFTETNRNIVNGLVKLFYMVVEIMKLNHLKNHSTEVIYTIKLSQHGIAIHGFFILGLDEDSKMFLNVPYALPMKYVWRAFNLPGRCRIQGQLSVNL